MGTKPIYAFNETNEFQPAGQLDDLVCALQSKGIDSGLYKTMLVPGMNHAFKMWRDPIADGPGLVRDEVKSFFHQYAQERSIN